LPGFTFKQPSQGSPSRRANEESFTIVCTSQSDGTFVMTDSFVGQKSAAAMTGQYGVLRSRNIDFPFEPGYRLE